MALPTPVTLSPSKVSSFTECALAYRFANLDRRSGALLEQHYMPEEFHQSGIRHLDVNHEGLVALTEHDSGLTDHVGNLAAVTADDRYGTREAFHQHAAKLHVVINRGCESESARLQVP